MTNSNIIIWKDQTITYKVGKSTFTEKIVEENEEYFTVVGLGAGEELWNAGYSVGNRVYKNLIDLSKI
jgi:hypothetical protein